MTRIGFSKIRDQSRNSVVALGKEFAFVLLEKFVTALGEAESERAVAILGRHFCEEHMCPHPVDGRGDHGPMISGGMGGGAHLVSLFFAAGRLLGQLPGAVVALHCKEAGHYFDGLRIGTGHVKREKWSCGE